MTVDEYWRKFLKDTGRKETLKYNGEVSFGYDAASINQLNALVLSGQKTATCSALQAYDINMDRIPKAGEYYIVTDFNEEPVGIIEDTNISILPFKNVTWELARKAGEENSIEEWRQTHKEFFTEEGRMMGYDFSEELPVVFEEFTCVYKS